MQLADGRFPAEAWHKSSYSGTQTECVEVARIPDSVGVRDTKHRDAGALSLPDVVWQSFLSRM